jgi:hypothetical protein
MKRKNENKIKRIARRSLSDLVNSLARQSLTGSVRNFAFMKFYTPFLEAARIGWNSWTPKKLATIEPWDLFERVAARNASEMADYVSPVLEEAYNNLHYRTMTAAQAKRFIRRELSVLGISDTEMYRMDNALTTVGYTFENARIWNETYDDPDVWGYRYITAADEKVRENHAVQHFVTLPKDDPFWIIWWPPNGWNCRCIIEVLYSEPKIIKDYTPGYEPDQGFAGNRARDMFLGV